MESHICGKNIFLKQRNKKHKIQGKKSEKEKSGG